MGKRGWICGGLKHVLPLEAVFENCGQGRHALVLLEFSVGLYLYVTQSWLIHSLDPDSPWHQGNYDSISDRGTYLDLQARTCQRHTESSLLHCTYEQGAPTSNLAVNTCRGVALPVRAEMTYQFPAPHNATVCAPGGLYAPTGIRIGRAPAVGCETSGGGHT